ncbi:hypothetical protein CIPAW_09G128000 [Carya illinoinensis]|uniref:Uncharacterized protein n=1 Tax=Carya illinoinensis TaxID=32201 RepID=A0A8T1PH59_CARIL|nr:hypothetical protein CIPAW_09G128000 [Carya illinoinensis]
MESEISKKKFTENEQPFQRTQTNVVAPTVHSSCPPDRGNHRTIPIPSCFSSAIT